MKFSFYAARAWKLTIITHNARCSTELCSCTSPQLLAEHRYLLFVYRPPSSVCRIHVAEQQVTFIPLHPGRRAAQCEPSEMISALHHPPTCTTITPRHLLLSCVSLRLRGLKLTINRSLDLIRLEAFKSPTGHRETVRRFCSFTRTTEMLGGERVGVMETRSALPLVGSHTSFDPLVCSCVFLATSLV